MQGGASGAVIEPGDLDGSYLFALVNHDAEPYMPMGADKIPAAEIDLLRRWIEGGALENKGSKAAKPKAKMSVAVQVAAGERPEVIPLPPRMVLEPHYPLSKPCMARSLATSPWASLVAVASQRQVLLYNTATLELVGVYPFPEGQPNVVRFSRDGRLLIVGGGHPAASGKVVVWDIATAQRVTEIGNELDVVLAADISADHKLIALGGPPRVVRVYSTETGELKYEITKHTDWVLAVEFSPDGVLLATSDRSGGLHMWEAHTGRDFLTLAGHTGAVTSISWRGDSNLLASGSEDGTVRLWEPENGTQVKNWNAKTAVLSLEFAREGRLVTCGRDQITRVWDQDAKQLAESAAIGDVAVSVTFCDESQRAIAASWTGAVQVYKADDADAVGSLLTNPPTLEERLLSAQKLVEERSAAAAPAVEAAQKAATELASAQAFHATAKAESDALQAKIDQLTSQVNELTQSRAATDAQRAKAVGELTKTQAAHPAVAEALRHLTEALGKLPQDTELVALQQQLTEQLSSLEVRAKEYQAKIAELTAAIDAVDSRLNESNAALETSRTELATTAARVAATQDPLTKAMAAAEAARRAAEKAEAEVTQHQHALTRWQNEIAFRDAMVEFQVKLETANTLAAERQRDVEQANQQLATAKAAADGAVAKLQEATQGVEHIEAEIRKARGIE
jgi:predicted  nucleic acid-binding Zn-ribbon protein